MTPPSRSTGVIDVNAVPVPRLPSEKTLVLLQNPSSRLMHWSSFTQGRPVSVHSPVGESMSARRVVAQHVTVVLAEMICCSSLTIENCTVTVEGTAFSKSGVHGTRVRYVRIGQSPSSHQSGLWLSITVLVAPSTKWSSSQVFGHELYSPSWFGV